MRCLPCPCFFLEYRSGACVFKMFGSAASRRVTSRRRLWMCCWISLWKRQSMFSRVSSKHCRNRTRRELRPDPKARKEQAEACHRAQMQYISASCKSLFPSSASNCMRHPGKSCPRYFPDPTGFDLETLPLKVNFSGPMCSPFTSQGPQLGMADPSIESLNLWLAKMSESPMDLVFFENSDRFPWSLFAEAMSAEKHWECHRGIFGAEDRGRGKLL